MKLLLPGALLLLLAGTAQAGSNPLHGSQPPPSSNPVSPYSGSGGYQPPSNTLPVQPGSHPPSTPEPITIGALAVGAAAIAGAKLRKRK